ncbi:MAG: GspE/PulE family protein, partial [Lysinibacillus sp.]
SLPKHMQNMVTASIKILGRLNITESRIPHDGRIKTTVNYRPVDIRLSTLPTVYGEKVVMRILDLANAATEISQIGFSEKNEQLFRKMIEHPNGIVLITGPTGSGKSSTLYAALTELNTEGVNIITVEDPVEYRMSGVNQIQVKEEVGLTFAAGLRSILRQDPDIVMIGEIRDLETAQIAIRASLTGHLVLSTLHTNSAIESISRLDDMGIEPFLISSSLVGTMAQRLVRRVCRDCASDVQLTEREREIFAENGFKVETVKRGRGCTACNNTGYRGRLAIHEILPVDRRLKELILSRASGPVIRDYMRDQGYLSLLQDGLLKVIAGATTTEEVLRVAMTE